LYNIVSRLNDIRTHACRAVHRIGQIQHCITTFAVFLNVPISCEHA
jgi:hypothetical protein